MHGHGITRLHLQMRTNVCMLTCMQTRERTEKKNTKTHQCGLTKWTEDLKQK